MFTVFFRIAVSSFPIPDLSPDIVAVLGKKIRRRRKRREERGRRGKRGDRGRGQQPQWENTP